MWIWRWRHCFLTALMNTDIGFVQINEDWIYFILVSLHYGSTSCIFRVPISTHYWLPANHWTTISPSPSRTERISQINVQITSIFFFLHYSNMVLYNCLFAVFFPLQRIWGKTFSYLRQALEQVAQRCCAASSCGCFQNRLGGALSNFTWAHGPQHSWSPVQPQLLVRNPGRNLTCLVLSRRELEHRTKLELCFGRLLAYRGASSQFYSR